MFFKAPARKISLSREFIPAPKYTFNLDPTGILNPPLERPSRKSRPLSGLKKASTKEQTPAETAAPERGQSHSSAVGGARYRLDLALKSPDNRRILLRFLS